MAITIKEIALLSGVSTATVSKVANKKDSDISEATRQKVLRVIEENGYIVDEVAQSMITKKTDTLGLLIPDISNPFFTEMAKGAEDEASKRGYLILLCNSYENFEKELKYIKKLIQKRVGGILLAGTHERFAQREQKLKLEVPIVAFDRKVYYSNVISTISSNNQEGSKIAVEFLIEKGCRKIAYLGGEKNNFISINRFEGYKEALEHHHLSVDMDLVMFDEFTHQAGYKMMSQLNLDKVDSVFCANDLIAMGALRFCQENGIRVPADISLIGVDNTVYSAMTNPTLTTMDQMMYEMGRVGCQMMIDYLEGKEIEEEVVFRQKLMERKSVKHK